MRHRISPKRTGTILSSKIRSSIVLGLLLGHILLCHNGWADDWPQWRGPQRDATSAEKGLLTTWPEGGPKVAWQAAGIGTGYSSVVVGQDRLLTMGRKESDVLVTALNAKTGELLWTTKIGETTRHPCSTPTLDGDLLYALDPDGDLVCLKAANGDIVWRTQLVDDFGGRMMSGRGYGESPLIDGERLICTPGGIDAAMVALNKKTGTLLWKSKLPELGSVGRDGAGFSSVVVTEAAGLRQYVQLVGRGLIGIEAREGRFLWGYNDLANNTANIPTPIVYDDFVFAANGYSAGSVLLKLVPALDPDKNTPLTPPGVKAELVYALSASQFQNHHGGLVRLNDLLFAGHGNNNGLPTCLDLKTGRVLWKRRGPGIGSAAVIAAEGQLYFRYQNGVVALIEASPRALKVNGTFEVPGAGGDSWAHPVIANGLLYLREQDRIWVYDLRHRLEATTPELTPHSAPLPEATLVRFKKLGIKIEPLTVTTDVSLSRTASDKSRRTFNDAVLTNDKGVAQIPHQITLTDMHFSSEGAFASTELAELLDGFSGPYVLNLAATPISDNGLTHLPKRNLVGLNLELCTRISDVGLESIGKLNELRVLVLTGTGVTATGLKHLIPNPSLLALDLELCDGVSDAACQPLSEMKQLKSLILKKSGFEKQSISDAGLQALQSLQNLEVLNLYGNRVTNLGLSHLKSLPKLRSLNLSLMAINDSGLKELSFLKTLQHLELLYSEGFAGPTLTDGMTEHLERLTTLRSLNVTGAKLTDAGLKRLQTLENLKQLQIVRTRVTTQGVQSFQAARPDCEVFH